MFNISQVYFYSSKQNLLFYLQIFLLIIISSICIAEKLETIIPTYFQSLEKPVLINFPKKINFTKITAQRFYLPPEIQNILIPEVIDNRLRSSSGIDFQKFHQSNSNSHILLKNDQKDNFYKFGPSYIQSKQITESNSRNLDTEFVKVNTMSCRNSGEELYFRASLTPLKSTAHPIIENVGSDNCQIDNLKNEYKIDFDKSQFWNCGIINCSNELGNNYCLNLRFPIISGLKLKEDYKITLQCRGQDKTISHVKKIHLNTLDITSRISPKVETGGYKNNFQTDIALYRKTYKSKNIFDVRIESGGTVILGEEILLRVLIQDGDGWKYSKINDVTIHFVEKRQRKKIINSLWILDDNGCLNPQVRKICSREQYRVSPLESYLIFRAFMFENMKESDEMILSVKVTGCLDGADCILNCPAGHVRSKRNLQNNQNKTIEWDNDIELKVIFAKTIEENSFNMSLVIIYASFALILTAAGILIYLIKRIGKK